MSVMEEQPRAQDTERNLYEAAFERSLDGIIIIVDGRIERANDAFCALHGLERGDVLGLSPIKLIHPEDREEARTTLEALLRGDASECARAFRLPPREDTTRWIEATCRSFLWKDGQVVLAIMRDVTGKRRMAGELRDSESRYQGLYDSVPIGLYRTTPDGKIVDVNPTLVRMLGYPSRENLLEIAAEDGYVDPDARRTWQKQVEAEGVLHGSEVLWRTHDQEELWIEEHARAVRNATGETIYYEGSALDISHRKAIEAALEREKAYFEQLFAGSPEAVVLCSNRGVVQRANTEFLRLFNYTEGEAVGQDIDELVVQQGHIEDGEARTITGNVTSGRRVELETLRYRKDGTPLHVSVLAQPVFLDDKQVGLYAIYRDISRRVTAEEALREEKARFEQLYAASPEAIVLCSNDGTILRSNDEFARLFGFTEEEAAGHCIDRLVAPENTLVEEATALTQQIANGSTGSLETIRHRKDGTPIHVSILGKPICLDGEQVAVYGIYRDISARKAAEEALRETHGKVERLHEAALLLEHAETLAGVYRNTMDAAERILGYSRCALDIVADGHLITVATSEGTPKERFRRAAIAAAGIAGQAHTSGESSILDDPSRESLAEEGDRPIRSLITVPLGDVAVFQAASSKSKAYSDADGRLLEILLRHTSAAIERIRLESALKEQATHDPLTGVFNRRYFNEVIEKETLRATRYEHAIGLLMIDVNRFKQINDECGHNVGDDVLQTIATILQETVRETDLVVRYGGDEFLIVLTETGEDADNVAERIRSSVSSSEDLQSLAGMDVTVSVGTIAWHPEAGQPLTQVLAEADERMYEEKRRR